MALFDDLQKKEKLIKTSYEIDISLYEQLENLSNNKYDVSINKLVNICIEYLLKNRRLDLYQRNKKEITVFRSFLIRKSNYDGILQLKEDFNISQQKIVNIAIYNALVAEGLIKKIKGYSLLYLYSQLVHT